jgi:hypothetical protein
VISPRDTQRLTLTKKLQVIADDTANPAFVAADLLSQAEHGVDSQVVLIAIDLTDDHLAQIEKEVDEQANALPRVDIVRVSISKSLIVKVKTIGEAFTFSNDYAPEHLILHLDNAAQKVPLVENAGSVFVGPYTPERLVTALLISRRRSLTFPFQLWRLCFGNKPHTTYEWLCKAIQWCQHLILPKAHHVTGNHSRWT